MKEKQHSRINKNLSKTEARSKTDQESREFEDKKNDILDQLKQMELLEEHDELKVWDVKKIKNLTFPEKKSTFYYDNEKNEGWLAGLKNKTELFYLLSDEQGISREEYETVQNKKNIKPRSLFYLPKNTEEAFNEQEIRNDNSLLRYWDVGERVQNYSDTLTLPSGEKISLQEMYVAYTIYNTFKAYRDKNNNLKIWDAQQNEWKKFTARFFTEHAKSKLNKRKREKGTGNYLGFTGFGKPVEFLIKELPHLAKSNLLQINDFRVLGEKGGQIIRPKHKLARNGTAFIDGAGYMLGGEFANRKKTPKKQGKFNIVKLDSITAGVVEERPGGINEIVKIFKLKSEDEKNERLEKIKERHKRGEIKGDPTSLRGF